MQIIPKVLRQPAIILSPIPSYCCVDVNWMSLIELNNPLDTQKAILQPIINIILKTYSFFIPANFA